METTLNINNLQQVKEYLNDSYKFELEDSKLIAIENFPKEEEKFFGLIFDKTIFHPQGGGQPSDEGEIELLNTDNNFPYVIKIESLLYDRERDLVLHKVSKENFTYKIGDVFKMKINEEKRRLYARLHSAGHLLDIAIGKLGLNLTPGKGYHFIDGPYVEYSGAIDKSKIADISTQIEKISNELIENSATDDSTDVKIFDYEEAKGSGVNIPTYLPVNKPFRWIKLLKDDLGCPCGGTHVKHIKDILGLKINKITNKGKLVRISYGVLQKFI
jgi:Ser-tRNA(Ala) deacylase AlaX